jgi:hypothetical protein
VISPLPRSVIPVHLGTIIFFILQNILYINLDFIFIIYNKHIRVLPVSLL